MAPGGKSTQYAHGIPLPFQEKRIKGDNQSPPSLGYSFCKKFKKQNKTGPQGWGSGRGFLGRVMLKPKAERRGRCQKRTPVTLSVLLGRWVSRKRE